MQNTGPPNYQGMMGQGMNYSNQYENQMVCPPSNYMYPQARPAYRQPRQLYNSQPMHAAMGYNNSPQRQINYHQPATPQNQFTSQDQYASMYPTERKQQWQQQQPNNSQEVLGVPQMVPHRGIPHNSIPQSPHHYHQMGTAVASPWPQQAQIPSPRMMGASPCTSPHHAPSAPPPSASQQCVPPNNPLQSLQKMVLQDGSKADIPPAGYGVINHDSRTQQAYYPSGEQDQTYQTYYNMDQNKLCSSPNNINATSFNSVNAALIPEPVLDGLIPPPSSTVSSSYEKQHCHHPITSDVIPNPDSFPPMGALVSNSKAFQTPTESILLQPMEKLIPIPATGATAEAALITLEKKLDNGNHSPMIPEPFPNSMLHSCNSEVNRQSNVNLQPLLLHGGLEASKFPLEAKVASYEVASSQLSVNKWQSKTMDFNNSFKDLTSQSIPESTDFSVENSFSLDKEVQISPSPIADSSKTVSKSSIIPINGILENGSTGCENSQLISESFQTCETKSPPIQLPSSNFNNEVSPVIKLEVALPTCSLSSKTEASVIPKTESDMISEPSLPENDQQLPTAEAKIKGEALHESSIPQDENDSKPSSDPSNLQPENLGVLCSTSKSTNKSNESDAKSNESETKASDAKSNESESKASDAKSNESESKAYDAKSNESKAKKLKVSTDKEKQNEEPTFSKEPIQKDESKSEQIVKESQDKPVSDLAPIIPKKSKGKIKDKTEPKTRSKRVPQKRQPKVRPIETRQKVAAKNKRNSESAKIKKNKNKKNVAQTPSTSAMVEVEQCSQIAKPKKPAFVGPYIHIEGTKLHPFSVTVVNMASKEKEEVTKEKPVKTKRDQGSNIGGRKKMGLIHTSTLSPSYDAITRDKSWICMFCHKGSHYQTLGDLFGPYYYKTEAPIFKAPLEEDAPSTSRNLRSKRKRSGSVEEVPKSPKKAKLAKSQKSIEESPNEGNSTNTKEFWVHEECAIWTPGVFMNGPRIQGLEQAVAHAVEVTCAKCKLNGASLSCVTRGCTDQYHYLCSRVKGCIMEESNYNITCPKHKAATPSKTTPENTRAHKALCYKKKGMIKKPSTLL